MEKLPKEDECEDPWVDESPWESITTAMHQLQANCVQVPALAHNSTDLLPAAPQMSLLESAETQELALPTATAEESAPEPDLCEPMPLDKVQETLNKGRLGESIVRSWLRANPHSGYVIVDGLVVMEDGFRTKKWVYFLKRKTLKALN